MFYLRVIQRTNLVIGPYSFRCPRNGQSVSSKVNAPDLISGLWRVTLSGPQDLIPRPVCPNLPLFQGDYFLIRFMNPETLQSASMHPDPGFRHTETRRPGARSIPITCPT